MAFCVFSTRGSIIPAEQIDQLQEKAHKELMMVRQRLDETLNQERRAMRCGLIKKRRELISDMVRKSCLFKHEGCCFCISAENISALYSQINMASLVILSFTPFSGKGPQTETEGFVSHVQSCGGKDRVNTAPALLAELIDRSQL